MDAPLWTETHAPALSELPQADARERLTRVVDEPMNVVIQGPAGVGKTAAARALARETHADPANDLVEINVADFFDRTKKEIREDPRFESFLTGRSRMAKRDMINRVLKESASYAPVSGEFKTILLDNAEAIREDFQQALRRVMERFHRNTQFVLTTRGASKLIPPIRSRCFAVPMRAPTMAETVAVLRRIVEAEEVPYDDAALGIVAAHRRGDLRHAVLAAQTVAAQEGELVTETVHEPLREVGHDDVLLDVLRDAREGEVRSARSSVSDLIDDEGYDGSELLRELLRVARTHGDDLGLGDGAALARLYRLAGEVDYELADGLDDALHVTHLLTAWGAGAAERGTEANA
jgi:replication factor C small subunit